MVLVATGTPIYHFTEAKKSKGLTYLTSYTATKKTKKHLSLRHYHCDNDYNELPTHLHRC